ncbi:hypothetical protein [Pseudoflavonifractor phocaeensis]|uniref:hypothetical protein n=1 Tax=Pseudoflavonifractor phocaeensis TaxID=1870988 RepID=UPI00210CCD6F|nr:hypothetical protein [Pseudoflavonifractor phocaeensis]MCQ4864800.1 hypothetical protein [Pseudoflavonifractor phocaeensis]
MMSYAVSRWCLKRGRRFICILALALLGAGMVYGVLRLTGIILFAGDNYMSYHFFGAGFRDDGFPYIFFGGVLFLGTAAAFAAGQHDARAAAAAEREKN